LKQEPAGLTPCISVNSVVKWFLRMKEKKKKKKRIE